MPSGKGVALSAMFATDTSSKVTLTYYGRWSNYAGTLPSDLSPAWKLSYIDPAYVDISFKNVAHYYPVMHIYTLNSSTMTGSAWIEAPSYPSDEVGDMVFDHWEVTETNTGKAWTEENAVRAVYNDATGKYELEEYCPDGATDTEIVICDIDKSITLIPKYTQAKYTLTVNYADGSTDSFSLAAGEKLDITGKCGSGFTHDYWSSSYEPISETSDEYGQITREPSGKIINESDYSDIAVYTYTMPKGDATVVEHQTAASFELAITGGGMKLSKDDTEYLYGDEVIILPDNNRGYVLDGINILGGLLTEKDITISKNNDGEITRISFVMPASDVNLSAKLKALDKHKITIQNGGTAKLEGSDTALEKTTTCYYAYKGDMIRLIPPTTYAPGYQFGSWYPLSTGYTLKDCADNEAVFTMPDADVTIRMDAAGVTQITSFSLTLAKQLAGLLSFPVAARCSGTGLRDEYVSVSWSNPDIMWENPARFGEEYEFSCVLYPKDGYAFADTVSGTWNGKTCTITKNSDESITVKVKLTTDKAKITAVDSIADVYVRAGMSMSDIMNRVQKYVYVTVGDNELNLEPSINWNSAQPVDKNGDAYIYNQSNTTTRQEFYVEGVIDTSNASELALEILDGALEFADASAKNVKVKIVTIPVGNVGTPVATDKAPGTYTENIKVKLGCDTQGAEIYYIVSTVGASYDESDFISYGDKFDPSEPISLTTAAGTKTTKCIFAMAFYGEYESEIAVLPYVIDRSAAPKYKATVVNGSGSGEYCEGATVDVVFDKQLANTTLKDVKLTGSYNNLSSFDNGLILQMANEDVKITACYEINKVNISIAAPKAGSALASSIGYYDETSALCSLVNGISYTVGGQTVTGTAGYETSYTGKFTLTTAGHEGYSFASDVKVYVNGNLVTSTYNQDGTVSASVDFAKTEKRQSILAIKGAKVYDKYGNLLPTIGDGIFLVYPGETVRIVADDMSGVRFAEWAVNDYIDQAPLKARSVNSVRMANGAVWIGGSSSISNEKSVEFIMPDKDITLEPKYNEVISNLELEITFAQNNTLLSNTVGNIPGIKTSDTTLTWYKDGLQASGKAEVGFYLATVSVKCEDGKVLDENPQASINGCPCSIFVSADRTEALVAIVCSAEGALIREIEMPADITGVAAHTPLGNGDEGEKNTIASLLPTSTTVLIDGVRVPAKISWDMSATEGYNPALTTEQRIIVHGIVDPIYEGTEFDEATTCWAPEVFPAITLNVTVMAEQPADSGDNNSSTGKMGDDGSTFIWTMLMVLSAGAGIALFLKRRKED